MLGMYLMLVYFLGSMEKMPGMAPNGALEVFFSRLIQTLPTFWAERIWILRIVIFVFCGTLISGCHGTDP